MESQVRVKLAIYSDDLDPTAVSRLLSLTPTMAHRKDELINVGNSKVTTKARTGLWLLSTEGMVASDNVEEHIEWLLKMLETPQSGLAHLLDQGFEIQIRCAIHTTSDNTTTALSVYAMKMLVQLQIPLVFDAYFLD